ncbi:Kelch repeat-containing protein [Colletotrichum higginsianum IMI 349063]|uniref:Kelch repeat-containing protein n=2 Tax=Colletotrichum higginsianum TaxID=80884 RepID=A0A1B7YCP5_COLHI|nr:Kelch repeat-containing protein [Colletotrichum higginsianum IMI 349063]OBR09620.1 Kelch repeat-containing protein [Colletotrichum higginsianum IMI 349063]TIC96067.1 Kelch-like protein 3 [Colletotrichum higginsianum]
MAFKKLVSVSVLSSLLTLSSSHPYQPHPRWENLTDIPIVARQEHTGVMLPPDNLVIFGGIIPNASAVPIPFTTVNMVQSYSIGSKSWRTLAPLPRAMNHVNVAVVDGKVYAFGGLDDGGPEQMVLNAVGDSWVYDPAGDAWTPLPPVPDVPRGMAALGVHDGRIFLAGGFTALGMRGQGPHASVSDVSVFDTKTGKWLPDLIPANARHLPAPRDHAGYVVVDGKLYVVGGFDNGTPGRSNTVFILDLTDLGKGWKTSAAQMPTARGGFAWGLLGSKLYTFGGEGNPEVQSGTFNETEVYDLATDSWAKLEPMPVPRHSVPGFAFDGKVYIPGGGLLGGAAPTSHFDVYYP